MEDNTFYVINEEGRRIVCESLFTFESRTTGKNYIIYTDNSQDESGNTRVFASIYDPDAEAPCGKRGCNAHLRKFRNIP